MILFVIYGSVKDRELVSISEDPYDCDFESYYNIEAETHSIYVGY